MEEYTFVALGAHIMITLSRATEQYCAAGAILKPLCLSKQLTLYSQQHIDQLFPGHIVTTSHFTVEFLIPISHLNILQFI